MEAGKVVRVYKDFFTVADTELCVSKDEILQIIQVEDRHWVKCRGCRGEGLVPSANVIVVDEVPRDLEDGHFLLVADVHFGAEREGDLSLLRGDIVIGLETIDESWTRGRSPDGRVGIFPTSFCWRLDSQPFMRSESKAKVEKFAQVVHSMKAMLEEEMDLSTGQIVKITEIIDKDWFRGESNGKSGIFPSSFVRIIDSFPGEKPPDSADLSSYLNAGKTTRTAGDYMNTRNAFHGLDENLKALAPKPATLPNIFRKNQNQNNSGSMFDDPYFRANLPASYESSQPGPSSNSVLEELGVAATSNSKPRGLIVVNDQETVLGLPSENCSKGYENLVKNLSMLRGKDKPEMEDENVLGPSFRYQNITTESIGYTGADIDVKPYGIAKFNFVSQFDNEISLNEGDMVYLIKYVDKEWIEAEIEGRRGYVPISYINIIVDTEVKEAPEATAKVKVKESVHYKSTAVTVHENLLADTFHKVLYTFQGQMEGDLSVSEGEVVRICEMQNEDWYVVENSFGDMGLCPGNHLDPSAEFSGKVQFDIERLLSYKNERLFQEQQKEQRLQSEAARPADPTLKFFDPLCSPTEDHHEMLKMEAELEKKASEANSGNLKIPPRRPPLPYSVEAPDIITSNRPSRRDIFQAKKQPKDIESLISNNLSKLRNLSPSSAVEAIKNNDGSNLTYERLDVAKSVLVELKGKNPAQPEAEMPPPPKPPPPRLKKKAPPPPKPPAPLHRAMSLPVTSSSSRPDRPPPPATQAALASGTSEEEEPMYARVKKQQEQHLVRPPRPEAPKLNLMEHTEIVMEKPKQKEEIVFKRGLSYTKAEDEDFYQPLAMATNFKMETTEVVHKYDLTPTNDLDGSEIANDVKAGGDPDQDQDQQEEETYPELPTRTSSILPRPAMVAKGETFRSYINLKDLEPPPSFPPDRNSPMSPPEGKQPPKVASLPSYHRSASVASSVKSRSIFYYNSVASERGDSPWCSSLNHSYETLNMPDSNESVTPVKLPHRPAPPVPASPSISRKNATPDNQGHADPDQIDAESVYGENEAENIANANKRQRTKNKHLVSRRTLRQRKIHSLKRQIQIKEKMLEESFIKKEQLLRELDMYQEIAVAKGGEYDILNKHMDNCQSNIEHLSDEIQRLQACLADEELMASEESIEELRRRAEEDALRVQLEAQRREEERRLKEERKKKNKEHRENVTGELLLTEREFCRDLKLTWQAFGLDTPEVLEQRGVEVAGLFGNLEDVIEVSSRFMESLASEVKNHPDSDEQMIGKAFLLHADDMKKVYTDYCINHDKAEQLLEKYESVPEVQRTLQRGVETLQSQVVCFNMGSILIKPVQRILKYPLMLNELIKCTESEHNDRNDLLEAVSLMADVAAFINESKRRKDIVDKYKSEEEKTLTRKISKLNMHSIGKKSTRIGQRLLSSMGVESSIKDLDYDELERRFTYLSRYVQLFIGDVKNFRRQLHESVICQFNVAQNVADLYRDRVHIREVERFRTAHKNILSKHWNEFNGQIERRVIKALQTLLETFASPNKLVQKRQDKFLDFSASSQKAEKNKDFTKTKSLQEEAEKCKTTYEALNSQLLEELPKLLELSSGIFCKAIMDFVLLRKLFVGRVTKELLSLMDLPLLASTSGDILEVFLVKHSLVCTQLGRFSFSSKTFRPEEKRKTRNLSPTSGQQPLGSTSSEVQPQTSGIRTFLRGKYAAAKLFQANRLYIPADPFDVGVHPGDLVGVIQKKDPMGDSKRWFVDNGVTQGFLPAAALNTIGTEAGKTEEEAAEGGDKPEVSEKQQGTGSAEKSADVADASTVHSYDEVTEEEDKKPVRKAPPVPPSAPPLPLSEHTEEEKEPPEQIASPSKQQPVSTKEQRRPSDQRSTHSYEEIAASEAEAASEVQSQDLSPIYEEINGGSRSSVSCVSAASSRSARSGSTSTSGSSSENSPRGKFFYSLYDFEATDATMLSVRRGQVVRVVHVTGGEWLYVEDRNCNKGYVPITYLKLYQMESQSQQQEPEQDSQLQEQQEGEALEPVAPATDNENTPSTLEKVTEEVEIEVHEPPKDLEIVDRENVNDIDEQSSSS